MEKIHLEKYKQKIKYFYFEKNLSLKKVARELRVSPGLIRKNMILWNISRRPSSKRDAIKPSRGELEELYNDKKLTMDKIAKKLDAAICTIFKWLKEYNIQPARRVKYKKYDFSGDPKEKAYILGLVAGDLYVCRNCKQVSVELSTTHPAMIDLFYSIFQKYGNIKKYLKYNKITKRYGWRMYIYLNNSFEFMLSKDFDIDNEYFYDFLAGFFDSEGCLHVYNNHGYIGVTALIYNSDKKLLEIIKGRLEKDGFRPKFSKFFSKGERTTNDYFRGVDLWVVRLHTNKEIISLMNLMSIKHKEKLDKLKIAISANTTQWTEVSERVNNLRKDIKEQVKDCIKPQIVQIK